MAAIAKGSAIAKTAALANRSRADAFAKKATPGLVAIDLVPRVFTE